MKAAGADVIVVLSHLGYTDGGYGYGIPVYGDQTLAPEAEHRRQAGQPDHRRPQPHRPAPPPRRSARPRSCRLTTTGARVGRPTSRSSTDGSVAVSWSSVAVSTTGTEDAAVKALIATYASDPDYLALVNTPIGYSQVDLLRNYDGDS